MHPSPCKATWRSPLDHATIKHGLQTLHKTIVEAPVVTHNKGESYVNPIESIKSRANKQLKANAQAKQKKISPQRISSTQKPANSHNNEL